MTKELYDSRDYDEEGEEIEKDREWGRIRGELTKQDKRKILRKIL